MRIALFVTCVNDTLYPATGRAVVRLLRRLGQRVEFPPAQTCCGQMHFNTGYREDAARLARSLLRAFAGYDVVVTPSGSCVAMIREYYPKLAAEHGFAAAADEVVPRVYELCEFLVDVLEVTDVGAYFPHRVTYHPTCHGLRMLRSGQRPYRLLSAVRGLELAELTGAQECCGFGGTFAVKNPAVSAAMCADKVAHVQATGADVLCAADNSCLMHLGGALSRQRTGVCTMHIAEILAATEKEPV